MGLAVTDGTEVFGGTVSRPGMELPGCLVEVWHGLLVLGIPLSSIFLAGVGGDLVSLSDL